MVLLAFPPTMDSSPEFCFCGRKTVESHEFWFCSTECARQDSLRSLGNRDCHYRKVVRDAYIQAGTPELQPRRMASAAHLRRFFGCDPSSPLTDAPHQSNMRNQIVPGLATRDRSKRAGFQNAPVASPGGPTYQQISLDAIPLPDHVPIHPLRRVPTSIGNIKDNNKKSPVAALLSFGRSRKGKEVENPEMVFGHPVNMGMPPVKKDMRRLGRAL